MSTQTATVEVNGTRIPKRLVQDIIDAVTDKRWKCFSSSTNQTIPPRQRQYLSKKVEQLDALITDLSRPSAAQDELGHVDFLATGF